MKPFKFSNRGFLGGIHENEIDRIEFQRTALRVLQDGDERTLQVKSQYADWRDLSEAEFRELMTAKPFNFRVFVNRHFPNWQGIL